MIFNPTNSKIQYDNFKFYGVDVETYYHDAGQKFAQIILKKFGKNKEYVIVCGLGGNGADGLATAYELARLESKKVNVYLIGRWNSIEDEVGKTLYKKLKESEKELTNLVVKQEVYAPDIENGDIIIEALVGTGIIGETLNKRFRDVIKRISHFVKPIIALDAPTPHYNPELTISINYPKNDKAEVIKIDFPADILHQVGPGELNALWKPKSKTHKTKNGSIILIEETDKNIECVKSTSKNYFTNFSFYSFDESKNKDFVLLSDLERKLEQQDTIIVGYLDKNIVNLAFVKYLLTTYIDKNFIFFGTSLRLLDECSFDYVEKALLIFDRKNIHEFFKENSKKTVGIEGKLKRFCVENAINAVLLGSQSLLFSNIGEIKFHRNLAVYKQGYQHALAGLVGAYSTRNDMWLSIRAALFQLSLE